MTYFWRIFLSVWAIALIAVTVVLSAGSWLPNFGSASDDARFAEQRIAFVAREMRRQLAVDPATAGDVLAGEQVLDMSPMLEIFVLAPAGDDVLGRTPPEAVMEVHRARGGSSSNLAANRPRLHVQDNDLDGHIVVGYEGYFPVRDFLLRPGGRGSFIALLLTISALVSFLLARFIVLPVRRLQSAEQRVADGDLSVRVAHTVGSRTDDIAKLAQGFDVMTKRIDELLQSQQRLMRDVSHELRSPLARLQALLSIARQTADDTGRQQIDRMETELGRLDELIGEILAFTRLGAQAGIVRHPTDIVDPVQNIVDDASLEGQALSLTHISGGVA